MKTVEQNNVGRYYALGSYFTVEDKGYDNIINRIEIGMVIDSGTNGMSLDKKSIMKKYFCDDMNIPDISTQYGMAKLYARAAIREGVEELKKEHIMEVKCLQRH